MKAGSSACSKAGNIAEGPRAASRAEARAEVRVEVRAEAEAGAGVEGKAEANAEVGMRAEAGTFQDSHRHPQICNAKKKKDELGHHRSNNRGVLHTGRERERDGRCYPSSKA